MQLLIHHKTRITKDTIPPYSANGIKYMNRKILHKTVIKILFLHFIQHCLFLIFRRVDVFLLYLTIEISFDGKVSTDDLDRSFHEVITASSHIGDLAVNAENYVLRAITGVYLI